jgi:hypothetical protein
MDDDDDMMKMNRQAVGIEAADDIGQRHMAAGSQH